ncbi:predicted protein [Naegleria gruberi]|uniref:Predicted protein n=1 Tax=Naegleria gruberi TaxID=5762 RepID=D2VWW9_NAEGR|nr:uncharacterized protein NAEGRDRAFT_73532 [Naegleria gruberi]EFC38701.1 predicted protein [Naegleria gruberi]|eukprot:XP_002671445.1 predicted protein [Naegleria gruberi strain NEG-M]
MTDPAISSVGQLYGETDTGEEGFKDFFEAHYCNELCLKLGLKHPNGDLYMEHPSLPKTISNTIDHVDFCSGYCCGNYIEYKIGEKTPDGTLFCNKCNQRNSITEKKVCKKKGCSLKFEIERWYWVSTGKHPPTKCHLHRGTIASELRDWKKNKTLPNGALFTQEEMQNQLDKDPDLKKQFEKSIIQEKKPDLFNTVVISNLPARTNSMDIFNMLPPFFTNRNQKVKVTELEVPSTFSIEFENEPIALEAYQILGSYIHRRRLIVCRPLQHKHESVKLDKSSINIQLSKYPNVKCSDILQYFKDSNYKIQDKYYEENKFANFTFSDPSIAPTLVSKGLSIDGTLVKVVYKKEKPITKQDVPLKNFKEKKIEIDENVDKTSVHIKWRPKNPSESVQLQEIDLLKLLNQSDIFKKKFNSAKSFMQITFKSEQSAALLIKNGLKLPNFKFTINFKKIQENERSNDCNEKRVQSEAKSKKEKQYPKVVANSLTPTSDSTTKNLKSNISTSNNQSPKQQNISKMQNLMFVFDINTLLKIGNLRNLLGQFLENHIQFCVPDIKLDEMNEDTFAVQNLVDEFKEINVQVPDESNNLTLRTLKVTKKVSDNYPNRNVMLVTDDKELKANADKFRLNVINSSAMNQLIRQSSVNNSVPKPIPSISNPSQKSTTIPTTNTVETIIIEPSNQRTTNTPVPVPVLQSMTKLISHGKRK